jgi:hypothetical protein
MEPLVISYCNSDKDNTHPNTQNFIRTLENNDWKYNILGRGDIWKGFTSKIEKYYEFLLTLDPNNIVILSDSRDVFCTKNPSSFINDFKKYNKKIVVSMEIFAEGNITYDVNKEYQQVTWIEEYWKMYNIDYNKINRKFVNSGLIAGYVDELTKFFKWSIDNLYTDDQKALGAYVNQYPELIYADIDAELLHNSGAFICGGVQYRDIQNIDSPTLLELIGNKSYFLHIPGLAISPGQTFAYNNINKILDFMNQTKIIECYPQFKSLIL